ncbi:hypothetical protein HJG60_009857 [Phyllostomus discolor]|uniref:Uncharacterized protein n=1 Tax=Phyllostomus discolor TaxID=89673 RepID=A0A834BCF2_9CHIR|nr:hypothetical protein HJG60_009857 [Phyllostomus discolor]
MYVCLSCLFFCLCLSHFHCSLSLCGSPPLSLPPSLLSCLDPVFPLPLALPAVPFPWLASPVHFPPGPSMASPRLPGIAQTSWLLSTPPAPAVPAYTHPSPSTHICLRDSSYLLPLTYLDPRAGHLQVLFHLPSNSRSAAWLYPFNS